MLIIKLFSLFSILISTHTGLYSNYYNHIINNLGSTNNIQTYHTTNNNVRADIMNTIPYLSTVFHSKINTHKILNENNDLKYLPQTIPINKTTSDVEIKNFVSDKDVLIMKPCWGSQGNGITVHESYNSLIKKRNPTKEYVVQEFITDTYTNWVGEFNGKKVNIRPYLMVNSNNGKLSVYMYNNIAALSAISKYNTNKLITNNKINTKVSLTNLHNAEVIYKKTLSDLKKSADKNGLRNFYLKYANSLSNVLTASDYELVKSKIITLTKDVFTKLEPKIKCKNGIKHCWHFMVFDLHPKKNLDLVLIEGNTRPGLSTVKYTFDYDKKKYKSGADEMIHDIVDNGFDKISNKKVDSTKWIKII